MNSDMVTPENFVHLYLVYSTFTLLALHPNLANLSLFFSYYFGRCSFELAKLAPINSLF